MTEKKEERNANTIRLFGMVLPSLPLLLLRSGGALLRFKRDAKKGGKAFHKELLCQGIDETTAAELTVIYLELSNIKNYMKFFR